jgi:putative redox protein
MVEIQIAYEGQLHCTSTHGPSGTRLTTDAPKDNMGRGESFSPTDLVATALGTCILTTMAIAAQRKALELNGATARVTKEMATAPSRRIARLSVEITIPQEIPAEERPKLEHAAHACPVHKSLHPDVEVPVTFRWGSGAE